MASEYLKWKYKDVKPEEKRELTPAEKRRNWWSYHWWHVLLGILLLAVAVDLICSALGIGRVKPDYQVAYVGSFPLTEESAAALQELFSSQGEDCNGDGQVTVTINQYPLYDTLEVSSDAILQIQGTIAKLIGDFESCDSFFFLLQDPNWMQEQYGILIYPDGSYPPDGEKGENCALRWTECPGLAEQGTEQLQGLWLARRGFWTGKTVENLDACGALWNRLTEGAG